MLPKVMQMMYIIHYTCCTLDLHNDYVATKYLIHPSQRICTRNVFIPVANTRWHNIALNFLSHPQPVNQLTTHVMCLALDTAYAANRADSMKDEIYQNNM